MIHPRLNIANLGTGVIRIDFVILGFWDFSLSCIDLSKPPESLIAKVCIEKKNTPVFLLVNKNYIKFHVSGSSEIMSQRSIFFTLSLGVNSSNIRSTVY